MTHIEISNDQLSELLRGKFKFLTPLMMEHQAVQWASLRDNTEFPKPHPFQKAWEKMQELESLVRINPTGVVKLYSNDAAIIERDYEANWAVISEREEAMKAAREEYSA